MTAPASGEAWYYNVEARCAETGPSKRGFAETRMGPYATQQEAEQALETLHDRDAARDEADRRWREGG